MYLYFWHVHLLFVKNLILGIWYFYLVDQNKIVILDQNRRQSGREESKSQALMLTAKIQGMEREREEEPDHLYCY